MSVKTLFIFRIELKVRRVRLENGAFSFSPIERIMRKATTLHCILSVRFLNQPLDKLILFYCIVNINNGYNG
jgi:hypothetical protein